MYTYVYMYIYIYIHRERERERDTERHREVDRWLFTVPRGANSAKRDLTYGSMKPIWICAPR